MIPDTRNSNQNTLIQSARTLASPLSQTPSGKPPVRLLTTSTKGTTGKVALAATLAFGTTCLGGAFVGVQLSRSTNKVQCAAAQPFTQKVYGLNGVCRHPI